MPWFEAQDPHGRPYWYDEAGNSTWEQPPPSFQHAPPAPIHEPPSYGEHGGHASSWTAPSPTSPHPAAVPVRPVDSEPRIKGWKAWMPNFTGLGIFSKGLSDTSYVKPAPPRWVSITPPQPWAHLPAGPPPPGQPGMAASMMAARGLGPHGSPPPPPQAAAAPPPAPPVVAMPSTWQQYHDSAGTPYWHNSSSGETTWNNPYASSDVPSKE